MTWERAGQLTEMRGNRLAFKRSALGIAHGAVWPTIPALLPTDPQPNGAIRYRRRLLMVLGAVTLLRLLAIAWWPLTGDEAYHWEWADKPALGYFDHPPLHAWSMTLSTALFGHSAWAVRLPNALAGLTMALLLVAWTRRLAGGLGLSALQSERAAAWAGILAALTPIHAALATYATGDVWVSLAWTAGAWAGWNALERGRVRDWLLFGACLGFGILAKFLIVLLPAAVGLAMLVEPRHRRWLLRWEPWLAVPVALLVASPVLYWNFQHEWMTFVFNFSSRHYVERHPWIEIPLYIGSQMAVVTPLLWLSGMLAAGKLLSRRSTVTNPPLRYLACLIAVPFLAFLANAWSKRIGIHWPAVVYPAMYVLVPLCWELRARSARWRGAVVALPVLLTGLALTVAVIPPQWSLLPWMPTAQSEKNPPPAGETLGWDELAAIITQRQAEQQQDQPVFLCAAQYGFVANLRFALPDQPEVLLWEAPGHHGQQHRLWDDFAQHQQHDALFIVRKANRLERGIAELRQHFAEVGDIEAHDVLVSGHLVNRIWIVPCRGFDGRAPNWGADDVDDAE